MTENATQFQVSDVVRLKSGGPEMAVKRLMGVGVDCVWFEGDRLADGAWFESVLLTRVENPRLQGMATERAVRGERQLP